MQRWVSVYRLSWSLLLLGSVFAVSPGGQASAQSSACDAACVGDLSVAGDQYECNQCQGHSCSCSGISTDPGHPAKPKRTLPGDRDRGDCPPLRYRMDDDKRAGCPENIAHWAICGRPPTHFGRYQAWFVGGGAAFSKIPQLPIPLLSRGRSRKSNACYQHAEGTWGLDYQGLFHRSNVWLKYTPGRKQGGEGAYETDGGPELIEKICELIKLE